MKDSEAQFNIAAVERDTQKVQSQMQSNMEWIRKVMAANGLEAAGPVRIITNEFGAETYSFDVAQPVRKKTAGAASDEAGEGEGEADATAVAAAPGQPSPSRSIELIDVQPVV